jgi:mono/diheme cytochrome c family protein
MSRSALSCAAALACTLVVSACRQDMHDQPRLEPLEGSAFFDDGRAARPLPEGVVARGHLETDSRIYRGVDADGRMLDDLPVARTRALLERGRERYDIFCSPCHARTGDGDGMIVQRGYPRPTSFHEERLRNASAGYLFSAISNGFGVMPSYAAQVPVADRWAIVAYLRALQLSRNVELGALSADDRARLAGDTRATPASPSAGDGRHGDSAHE